MSNILPVERLRLEYRTLAVRLAALQRAGGADTPELLRLQAREMQIVDELRALGVPPDVLVAAA